MDLTKKIEVGGFYKTTPPDPRIMFDVQKAGLPSERLITEQEEFEEYRQLFQDAPRTKLEHGKMLAMLKQSLETIDAGRYSGEELLIVARHFDRTRALIAEIEGPPKGTGVPGVYPTVHNNVIVNPRPFGAVEGAAQ